MSGESENWWLQALSDVVYEMVNSPDEHAKQIVEPVVDSLIRAAKDGFCPGIGDAATGVRQCGIAHDGPCL